MGSAGAEDKMSASQSLLQKTGKTQAAFVPKLFIMVKNMKQPTPEDPNPEQPLISWSKTGDVFCVFDPIEFSRVILPLHFKHNNWQSFVRQLNMYGFHKVNDLLSSSHSQTESIQAWEFQHPHFKRDRPDLLPMIKRKSTKHHGASKPSSNSNNTSAINPQATKQQVGEIHPQRHIIPPSHGVPGRAGPRAIQSSSHHHHHHHHTSRVLPSTAHYNSLHHSKQPPPPPQFVHTGKTNHNLTNPPPRPPALYPILTHQFQYTHSTHSQLKSSPLTTHSNTKGSPTTRANPQSVIPCSPRSGRHPTSTGRPITSQSQQSPRCNLEEEEVTERSFSWSSVRETCSRSDSSLCRIEDELRRLNHTLAHRDPSGDHIFSVLGLIVELIMLLVDHQQVKVAPTQHEKLARYVHSAKEALGRLEVSNFCSHQSLRRCSGAPSTDSVSPVSTDPLERDNNMRSKLNSADSNFPQTATTTTTTTDGPSSAGWTVRPRWADRMLSSRSLPPLNTLTIAQCPPPTYNSSAALPASINRLMNVDTEEHPKVAVNSEEYQEEESQEEAEDEEEEGEGEGEGEESDDLDDVSYADEHEETDDDDAHEATRACDEGNGVVSGHGEPHSAADQHSFSDQLSSSHGGSTPERDADEPDVDPEQRRHSHGEMKRITYHKRPYNNNNEDVANGPGPAAAAHETSNITTILHQDAAHRHRKRPRAQEPPDLSPA